MTTDTGNCELAALTAHELHDMAVDRALELGDVRFVWELLRALPAADAMKGHQQDLIKVEMIVLAGLIADALGSAEDEIALALRPLYIRYLEHYGLPA